MAKVPYQGYSEVAPSTQNISGPTSAVAFGEPTARAVGALGESIDRAGDKLFQRAMAFQELDNHAENQNLQSGYTKEADTERLRFATIEGGDAKQNLVEHQNKLDEIRDNWAQKASNPKVLEMFNDGSKPLNVRLQGAAATHAASEFRKYQNDTAEASIKRIYDEVAMLPNDEGYFKDKLNELEATVGYRSSIKGRGGDVAKQDFLEMQSGLASRRADSLSKTDAKAGKEMFDKYAKEGIIRGDDLNKTGDKILDKLYRTGSEVDAQGQITGSNLRMGEGDPGMAKAKMTVAHLETEGQAKPYEYRGVPTPHGRALGKYGFMEEFLPEFLREAGMKSMTPAEFLASPQSQEQLFESHFSVLMKKNKDNFNEALRDWIGRGRADALGTDANKYVQRANSFLAGKASLADHRAAVDAIAEKTAPGDPLYKLHLDDAVIRRFGKQQSETRDTAYRTKDTLLGLASGMSMPDGKKPTTVDDLLAVPEGEIAWGNADSAMKNVIIKALDRNAKGDYAFTNETYKEYAKLVGLANSDDPKDRAAFLEQPPDVFMDKPWPFSKRDAIINLQRKMKNTTEGNPFVGKFLTLNAGQMNGIVDKKVDADDYFQFVGIAHDRILAAQADKPGQPLKDEDYLKIGRDMLYQKMEKGWFDRTVPGEPAYRMKPSPEEAERIKKLPEWGGKVPSDYWVNRYYQQQILTPTKEEKVGTREPAKTPPPSITDRLVGAIDAASAKMKEGREREAATEEDIRKQQEQLLIQRSLAGKTKAQVP